MELQRVSRSTNFAHQHLSFPGGKPAPKNTAGVRLRLPFPSAPFLPAPQHLSSPVCCRLSHSISPAEDRHRNTPASLPKTLFALSLVSDPLGSRIPRLKFRVGCVPEGTRGDCHFSSGLEKGLFPTSLNESESEKLSLQRKARCPSL